MGVCMDVTWKKIIQPMLSCRAENFIGLEILHLSEETQEVDIHTCVFFCFLLKEPFFSINLKIKLSTDLSGPSFTYFHVCFLCKFV